MDRNEQVKADFTDLMAQAVWLADRLSENRILVGHDECSNCPRYSFEECRKCWLEAAAKAVRGARHAS